MKSFLFQVIQQISCIKLKIYGTKSKWIGKTYLFYISIFRMKCWRRYLEKDCGRILHLNTGMLVEIQWIVSAAAFLQKVLNGSSLYILDEILKSVTLTCKIHGNLRLLEFMELTHLPFRPRAFLSGRVRDCYYQTIPKLQTRSVTQLHVTVYLWLLDEVRGTFWPVVMKLASLWLVPAPSLTDPLEATGLALSVLASLVRDWGGCQILEVTYCGACVVAEGLGNKDYKGICKWDNCYHVTRFLDNSKFLRERENYSHRRSWLL